MAKSKDLIKRPAKWFALETFGNGIYDLIGLFWRSAIMTTALALVVRFASAIPPDVRLIAGMFMVALVFLTLQLVIHRWRKRVRRVIEVSENKTPVTEDEKSIEALTAKIEGSNQQIRKLESSADTLQRCISSRDAELAQYAWLHDMADIQAQDIVSYVVVEQVRFCYHDLTAPIPFIIFGVDIHNKSVFDVTIENTIEGYIELAGERLLGDKELIHNPKISPSGKESLTIKQRLSSVEIGLVSRCENDELGAFYYFDKVVIRVAARTEFPQFERASLKLPQYIGSKDTLFSTEIASLKAQLEEEKAKRTKPDITGKIKGVYSEWWANGKLSDSKHVYFDYHFIINVYLANHGAVATIEQFKLILKVGERSYDGERETDNHDVKEGEMNWRAWGAGELDDLEKSNDAPLAHTRNGSLWFVVTGVLNTEDRAQMELELYVIDKDGSSYTLDTLPQSQWQSNPFLKKARMEEARARMQREF